MVKCKHEDGQLVSLATSVARSVAKLQYFFCAVSLPSVWPLRRKLLLPRLALAILVTSLRLPIMKRQNQRTDNDIGDASVPPGPAANCFLLLLLVLVAAVGRLRSTDHFLLLP